MTKADYIRQVDAMALPDGLYAKLNALPSERKTRAHNVRPYGRWATLAAALVLVVGLGVATPAILHALAPDGGDIITPPPIVTESPVIPDEELTELLTAQIPNSQGDEEFTLLTSLPQSGHTLGILRYSMTAHAGGFGNLLFGVFDNRTKELTDSVIINGDHGTIYDWYGNAEHTIVRILWTNYTEYQGWQDCSAGLYTFSGGKLTITKALLPYRLDMDSILPEGAEDMFDPEKNADFWTDRSARMNGGGITIYRRNPEYTTEAQDESIPQWIREFGLLFNFGEKSYLTGISDEELADLLAAEFPEEKTPQDTWKLLGSSGSPEGRTLGVLQYDWEGSDGTPDGSEKWSNLLLGVYDNATGELTAPAVRVNGQFTYALPYSTGSGGQDYYVLCVGRNFGQGIAEYYSVALYFFDGTELKQVTSSPNAVFPPGTEDMFDPAKNEDFWNSSHQIVLAPGGFELFERNPDWDASPDRVGISPWRYLGYVPLAYKYPDPAALEGARRFYEDYYTGSSYYSFQLCELVPDYEDIDYPNAHAYHVVLDVGQDAVMDRYFLFDEAGTLLGTRSTPEGSLTIGGVNYALGIHTRNIFGTPVKTNLVPSTSRKSYYSEWFRPNANACGYTYYPTTGEYRLSGISTNQENVYTAKGIHVGSTVAEVIAAYPEANKEFSVQTNCLSYYGPGFTIEFYFSNSPSREEMLKQTVTAINLSAEYW